MDHTKQLGTEPILKLIIKFSIPSIISMIVNALYNIVDRMFIGQYAGEDALAGLTVAFPFMMAIFAVGALFGVGGTALIAINFGKRDLDEAGKVYGNLAVLSVGSSIAMMILGQIFLPQILSWVGATPTVLPYAEEYMRVILLGLFFQISAFVMTALVRTEGKPYLAMGSQLISAITNILLDYIFIGLLGMGVAGGALATIIGQFVGFTILFYYFFIAKKSMLKILAVNLKLKFAIVRQICVIGMSTFVINIGTSLSASVTNVALKTYGGEAAIASMGGITSMVVLVLMPIIGLQQGIGPIIGYNHGMKQQKRVRKTFWTGIGLAAAFALTMFALMEIFPYTIARLFLKSESATIGMFVQGLRIQAAFMPMLPLTVMVTAFFQSTAQGKKGLVLSIGRQILITIAVIVLPLFWQLNGVWLSAPIAEGLTVGLAFICLTVGRKQEDLIARQET